MNLNRLRKLLLIVGILILGYLFALYVPIVPVQMFILGNCLCPLVGRHAEQVSGGWVVNSLYSITRYSQGFGGSYNVDFGYAVTGPRIGNEFLTGFGLFVYILPLIATSIGCFALAFLLPNKQNRADVVVPEL